MPAQTILFPYKNKSLQLLSFNELYLKKIRVIVFCINTVQKIADNEFLLSRMQERTKMKKIVVPCYIGL